MEKNELKCNTCNSNSWSKKYMNITDSIITMFFIFVEILL